MFKHIMVPLDGTERAERALPVAAKIARASTAQVTLFRVIPLPPPLGPAYEGRAMQAHISEEEEHEATEYLTRLTGGPILHGLVAKTRIAVGVPAVAILDSARILGVDLVVLCSHGRAGPARWLLGSIAEELVRQAIAPVLVLREHGPVPLHPHPDPEQPLRILIPLDGSPLAEAAIEPALRVALALAGTGPTAVHLATVLSPYDVDRGHVPVTMRHEGAHNYLCEVADSIREAHPNVAVSWSVTAAPDFADELLHVAETGEAAEGGSAPTRCDLIAMATHGRSGVAHFVLGSVTERVLRHTNLPVLVAHPVSLVKEPQPIAQAEPHASEMPSGPEGVWSALF